MTCSVVSFLELGGDSDVAVEYLSTSYAGVPKMINLLMQWLQIAGCKQKEIQGMVEEHFTSMILKHFDPKKADHVLVEGGEVRGGADGSCEYPSRLQCCITSHKMCTCDQSNILIAKCVSGCLQITYMCT